MLRLLFHGPSAIPLEIDCLCPRKLSGRSAASIASEPVWYGNRQACMGEFFTISGQADGEICLEGDCRSVKWIGSRMVDGRLTVAGNVGMHAGAGMQGGELVIEGDADACAGAEMRGGLLRIEGNAGDGTGSAYPGSRVGMRGGIILVGKGAGHELGRKMRRGLIAVRGPVGNDAGSSLVAGTILLFDRAGDRLGARMKRGTIACFAGRPDLLATFRFACHFQPVFMALCLSELQRLAYTLPKAFLRSRLERYVGDLAAGGKGEVLVADQTA